MAWIGSLQDLITGFGFLAFMVACFFSSFISSGDAAFIHAWALPAILLGRAKFFGESRPYDFPKIWAKTSLGERFQVIWREFYLAQYELKLGII